MSDPAASADVLGPYLQAARKALDAIEAWYAERNQRVLVQVSSATDPTCSSQRSAPTGPLLLVTLEPHP